MCSKTPSMRKFLADSRSAAFMVIVLTFIAVQTAQASSFNVIYNFTGGTDGANPYAGLTVDATGALYGTTLTGGAGNGTVFKLAKSGSNWGLTTLYKFAGGNDGATPRSGIVIGPDGGLYGLTYAGGGIGCGGKGCGTVFKLKKMCPICGWTETVLYRFTGGSDGAEPVGTLLFDASGSLYGTTVTGGNLSRCWLTGCGTVFKLAPSGPGNWRQSVLYQFVGHEDGTFPDGGVISDAAGNLYGTTCCGSSRNSGTVFELTPQGGGWSERILYAFNGSTDGNEAVTGLMFDGSGNLYGSTVLGGTAHGGTVFKLAPVGGSWDFSVLYNLNGNLGPYGNLTMDAAGNLYGTAIQDGQNRSGAAFKLAPSGGSWTYTSFHDFTNGMDGGLPVSSLVPNSSGKLYGTAGYGGGHGVGVVVEITP